MPDMETEVLIGLILGGAGLVLALLGLFVGLFARMAAGRTQRELEEFRQRLTTEQSAAWMKTKELENKLKPAATARKAVESVRYTVDILLDPGERTTAVGDRANAASSAGRALAKQHDDLAKNLDQPEQLALRQAREAAVELAIAAEQAATNAGSSGVVIPTDRATLVELRRRLTDCIDSLRTRQLNLLTRHVLDQSKDSQ